MKRLLTLLFIVAAALSLALAQEREDRTLLTWDQMRAIINESSGERALHAVLEMMPYPRVRSLDEYKGHFRESEVLARLAREYGYSDVEIESFTGLGRTWHALQAELWLVEPELRKLYDAQDVAVSVAGGSQSGDIIAELVDVGGGGRADDYTGKDVKGKIVLGSASLNQLQRQAVFERGAAGALSYSSIRADSFPDQIISQGVSANPPQGKQAGFGWSISPRVGRELAARLARGQQVKLRSVIQSETFPGESEVIHATIPGDGSTSQQIAISAHIYEGYQKQGASDNGSGTATTLEAGRVLIRLIKEGKLPRPRRTIHFLWIPEISGTMQWLNKHADIKKNLIANINYDMAGIGLRNSSAMFVLHRTPDTTPTFLNDVAASVLEFVGNTNRERVRYRHNGYDFTLPITAPNGSQDPFHYLVDKYYGASDHAVFLNQGIPAVIFNTWPDQWYHSSQDTPEKLDSTQLRRAAVVGAAATIVLAAADDQAAARVAAESLARGAARMGDAARKGLSYLADATDGAALPAAYREALVALRHQAAVEKDVVRSAAVLFTDPEAGRKRLATLETLVDQRRAALENEAGAFYRLQVELRSISPAEPPLTEAEKQAAHLIVERKGATGGAAFGALQRAIDALPVAERSTVQAALRRVPQHMTAELTVLGGRKKTVLEIRDFLSGEFEPLALDDLTAYLRAQEKLGFMSLLEAPPEPPAPPAPARKTSKKKR